MRFHLKAQLSMAAALTLSLLEASSLAGSCKAWSESKKVGTLEPSMINESSGLQTSRLVEGRIYHINDSGDGPNVYYSGIDGSSTKSFSIDDMYPEDVEALSMTRCEQNDCLVIADIGDNRERRSDYSLTFIKEKKHYARIETSHKTVFFTYPDKSHNAESIFFTNNGDFYVITKEIDVKNKISEPGYIFSIKKNELVEGSYVIAKFVGRLDLTHINHKWSHQVATDTTLSPDGKTLLVLNYKNVISFDIYSTNNDDISLSHPRMINVKTLSQQEAITFTPDGGRFIYDTELEEDNKGGIYQVSCLDR